MVKHLLYPALLRCYYILYTVEKIFSSTLAAKPPKVTSQPVSLNDILPGKDVTFSVEPTGTQPLNYQWQWKPFGEDEWQNLSAEGSVLRVEEIQACNAGYYQCVVSNSAGSETSHYASLTVGMHNYVSYFSKLESGP